MSRRTVAVCLLSLIPIVLIYGWLFNRSIDQLSYTTSQSSDLELYVISPYNRDHTYHAVETEAESDQVLELRVTMPRGDHEASYYLWKNPSSRWSGINGMNGVHCFSACGEDEYGKGTGMSGSETIRLNDQGLFEVEFSYSWRSSKVNGEFKDKITLPWRGDAKLEKDGVKVHAYFRTPVLNTSQK